MKRIAAALILILAAPDLAPAAPHACPKGSVRAGGVCCPRSGVTRNGGCVSGRLRPPSTLPSPQPPAPAVTSPPPEDFHGPRPLPPLAPVVTSPPPMVSPPPAIFQAPQPLPPPAPVVVPQIAPPANLPGYTPR